MGRPRSGLNRHLRLLKKKSGAFQFAHSPKRRPACAKSGLPLPPSPSSDYLVYQDERRTYADAHREVAAIANWMRQQGIEPGDRVAIAMRNYPEWMLIYWACMTQGVGCVGMNAWWVEEEMAYGLTDAAPKALFCDEERLRAVPEHQRRLPRHASCGRQNH